MPLSRRSFMGRSGAAMIAGSMASSSVWGANERISVGVIGCGGRGTGSHVNQFCDRDYVDLVALCDAKQDAATGSANMMETKKKKRPKTYTDMRELLDDKSIDAVSIATPNHWHTLAAIWSMQAGKDVYLEKPCSHNVWEGRQLANAAKKYERIIQHGTQIRSSKAVQEGIQKLKDGVIGEVYMARGLCYKTRRAVDKVPNEAPPADLDWNLWQGPAQEREYNKTIVPYNWHWYWAYGNSDMGNQGVHQMDIARWGLGVDHPSKISAMGGRFLFDDAKETPNVITTAFHYPDAGTMGRMLVFETRPFRSPEINHEAGVNVGVIFYGANGYMVIPSYSKYQTFLGEKGEPGPTNEDSDPETAHFDNFLECVKTRKAEAIAAPIVEGHISSSLCHLGLISTKLGRSLDFDPVKEQVIGDEEANAMLTRNYRAPFTVPAIEA
ncbi:MAG: Gfo/Idh/MocA family oxidoreductase [Candidatus Hydrogenedentes bacterium]|nr:Gfo/Idh/MocA family oxidoreductase [Candidatus Hydrogenedentota bacterium]